MVEVYMIFWKGFRKLWSIIGKMHTVLEACFTGLWLGILNRENFYSIDKLYYDSTKMYHDENYNRGGFWAWEISVLNKYFKNCKRLLVAGSGGGREVLALLKQGYEVDGFECNPNLVYRANEILEKEGFAPNIQLAPRDQCPNGLNTSYDGVIIGWAAYMLIQGRKQRVAFLNQLRKLMKEGAPILLSFFYRSDTDSDLRFKITKIIGNSIRKSLRKELLEIGDYLGPNYVHYFTKEQLASELHKGGFNLVFFSTKEYGHSIGIVSKQTG